MYSCALARYPRWPLCHSSMGWEEQGSVSLRRPRKKENFSLIAKLSTVLGRDMVQAPYTCHRPGLQYHYPEQVSVSNRDCHSRARDHSPVSLEPDPYSPLPGPARAIRAPRAQEHSAVTGRAAYARPRPRAHSAPGARCMRGNATRRPLEWGALGSSPVSP